MCASELIALSKSCCHTLYDAANGTPNGRAKGHKKMDVSRVQLFGGRFVVIIRFWTLSELEFDSPLSPSFSSQMLLQ